MAKIAWVYLRDNMRQSTGLVDSVAGYPSTTMWDQGSYLLGLQSAHRLNLVESEEFHRRINLLLTSLQKIPLFDNRLPNKAYDTRTLDMTDYQNNVLDRGLGWSAIDVARMLLALRVLERHTPEYGARIRKIIARWSLNDLAQNGRMYGVDAEDGQSVHLQEGRIGYEQYSARAVALWGVDVSDAISAKTILEWRTVQGTQVAVDLRRSSSFNAITPSLSEPYMLLGLELGFSSEGHILASQVYRAQEARFGSTGIATMVSEDHVNQAPHFLYSTVYGNGEDWAVITESGEHFPELRTTSVKATVAWDALFGTPYTKQVRESIQHLGSESSGWFAGYYEDDGRPNDALTLNTNAIVLEAIHFKAFGPLWQVN
ncbi:MAG: DUF3131 domain-containing protein [Pseudomonadota bacterium]